ncbi:MAG: HAD family phosphatase [Chitinophagaceae bacterium]
MKIDNIIFDFGGVLVDWNPRYLFQKHFADETAMEYFLKNICTEEWNLEQDKGRSLADGTRLLQERFPDSHDMIQLFYDHWETMLKCDIPGSVALLHRLNAKYKVYGLTNWSTETLSIAYERYPFFRVFEGVVVSGEEKLIKPDPRLFQILLDRYQLVAANSVFIDDNIKNVKAAETLGFHAIHFQSPEQLEATLAAINAL